MAQAIGRVRRRWLLFVVAAVVIVLIVIGVASGFYVDVLWFREVGQSGVFWRTFWTKLLLGSVFGVLFFLLLAINLFVARRLTPRFRVFTPEQEIVERYRAAIEPHATTIIPAVSALIALFVGIAVSGQWQTFLLWKSAHGVQFGAALADPVFHRDPSYYIFILPFWQFVQGWLFSALVGVTVIVGVAHYLTGGIRLQASGEKLTAQVRAHLSVLLGLILLVKAWGYYLGKFNLLTSERGVVTGASYTDLHAQLPALKLLVFIALACGILFLVNIRFRGWALPVIAIGLLGVVSIVVGGLAPAAVERFQVAPQQFQKEQPYIKRNIDSTRFAFGLSKIKPVTQTPTADITATEVGDNEPTISNIRLWNPKILEDTYLALQRIQPYYEFHDVDVDRYQVASGSNPPTERVVMMSPREVSQIGIPGNRTWQNTHLVYTHGYGTVASLANSVTSDGSPSFLVQNIPMRQTKGSRFPTLGGKGSQIYFGELSDVPYLVVDTGQKELNFQNPENQQQVQTSYSGSGGISVGSFWRRLVFAYQYRDFNLLISGLIDSNSKILIRRDIATRIQTIAPFLKYDADPYAAIVNGHLVFIQDAYTTTTAFPYSERTSLSDATNGNLLGSANYIRNSVKVTVDAYDGTVHFYVTDPTDPLIKVWENAFPHLFTTAPASAALAAHFRYPENLLQVQATQFSTYHVTDPQTFYSRGRQWSLPNALANVPKPNSTEAGLIAGQALAPYYVLLKLPGQTQGQEQFQLFEPFTPQARQNMVAYMSANSDGYPSSGYGQLSVYQFPSGQNVDGPQQVRNFISQDPAVSQEITLLSQQGSQVKFGDLLVLPIEEGFLYVQPIFVQSSGANAIPELKRVVVVHGGNVTMGNSLTDALDLSFGQTTPTPPPSGGPPPTGNVQKLLAQALQHFQAAQTALKNGDLATYQREIEAAQKLVQQAQQLAGKQGSGQGTQSPSPSPSPSATPSG